MRGDEVGHHGAQTLRPLRDILFAAAKNLFVSSYKHLGVYTGDAS